MGAAGLRSEWDEKWLQYCRERVLACGLPRSMPTPSPETLADALSKPWMAEAIAEAERRAHFLMLSSESAERIEIKRFMMPTTIERVTLHNGRTMDIPSYREVKPAVLFEAGPLGVPLQGVYFNYHERPKDHDWRDLTEDRGCPLEPLIDGWLKRPRAVQPSNIQTLPHGMGQNTKRNTERQARRYTGPAHFGQREGRQQVFPGFEVERDEGIYLPEELYHLAEKEGTRRGVVSLTQRALIYAMLRTPPEKAASPTGYWFRVPGKEYIEVTHQANKRSPRPSEWLPALRNIRDLLNTVDIPYLDADGKPRYFTPAAILDYPYAADGDIQFVTHLPEGYDSTGVRISARLWEFTTQAYTFYLMLSAPFLYERPGITWIPRKDGGVSHFKDIEAYPEVTRSMVARMANPFAAGKTRQNLESDAFNLLEAAARQTDAFQVARRKNARIILPPRAVVNLKKSAVKKGFKIVP